MMSRVRGSIEIGPRGQVMRRASLSPVAPLFSSGLNIGALLGTRVNERIINEPTWSAFDRPLGTLRLDLREAELPADSQSLGVSGSIELELERDGVWWRIARFGSDRTSFELSQAQLAFGRRLRVVASDGWVTVSQVIELGEQE